MSASNVVPFRPAPPQPELHLSWVATAELTPQPNRRRNPQDHFAVSSRGEARILFVVFVCLAVVSVLIHAGWIS